MYHRTFGSKPLTAMPAMNMGEMPGMKMSTTQEGSANAPSMHMVPEPRTDLSTTFIWGCTRSLTDSSKENSYLAEALLRFASTNYLWTRLENAGRSNELLLTPGSLLPPNFVESPLGHVAATTLGYDHDIPLGRHILAAPGAQITIYRTPTPLRATYGSTPTAEVLFIRFRLR